MRLFGLVGYPLTHSFSKKYFTEKFEREGLNDCRYELFPLETIDELPGLLKKEPSLAGLNITIPYKKQVVKFLDTSFIPGEVAACNCIHIREGSLAGYNTDIAGFEKSFGPLRMPHHTHALVLGHGGAAAAVTYVLKQLGIGYEIVSRRLHEGSTLTYHDLDKHIMEKCSVIINTTPLGMSPDAGACPPVPYEFITGKHLLYDLIYNPPMTLFLKKGKDRGATIKNGEEMLVIQAEESWRIWNT